MQLIDSVLYDPGTAASHSAATQIAMTAFDTTNLRLSFTVPHHGIVRVVLDTIFLGGASSPMILLGVLESTTVVARKAANTMFTNNTAHYGRLQADFIVSGLTPGPAVWDAAYSVQVAVTSAIIKYGGANDAGANTGLGGFSFEVWDPKPTGRLAHDWQLGGGC